MTDLQADDRQGAITPDELDAQQVMDLPPREAMTLISTDIVASADNVAIPTNEAAALNYQSNYSVAVADADQVVSITQVADADPDASGASDEGRGWGRGGRR